MTNAIENVSLLRCPPDARVKVEVPLEMLGEDASPGLRKGGTINTMRRKVACWCLGAAVPAVRALGRAGAARAGGCHRLPTDARLSLRVRAPLPAPHG